MIMEGMLSESYNRYRSTCREYISTAESNTVVSANTTYRHLQQYCSHPSICVRTILNYHLVHTDTCYIRLFGSDF